MATYYLMPSRPRLGERFAGHLSALFPGLTWSPGDWTELADTLTAVVAMRQADIFIIYRDELPSDEETIAALTDGFGATAGDEVIEICAEPEARELHVQRWRIGQAHSLVN